MYSQKDLESIDRSYFTILVADQYDVMIMSKNTRHVWQLHNVELPDEEFTVLFHKHHITHDFHRHAKCSTLKRAIREIKSHDRFQMNGRKRV